MKKQLSLYGIVFLISLIIRQFVLPNPFECFGEKAIMINWIAEPIIHVISFGIVGLFYIKGSNPTVGSFAYLITYAVITGLLLLFGIFSFAWWWITLIIIGIIAIILGIAWLKERLCSWRD